MYIADSYIFSPGEANQGTITLPAVLKLEDFGVITNVTRNSILYSPGEGPAGGSVTLDGGDTILTLEQSTTYCLPGDSLQIIILQDAGGGGGPATDVHVTNTALDPVNITGTVTVTNDSGNPASVNVENWPASVEVSNDIGNPLPVVGTFQLEGFASSATDAFGRLRVSNPYTIFDSYHRYSDNGLWSTSAATGGTATFNPNQGLVDLAVTANSGSQVLRETNRVFAYQPGKSLSIFTTFVLNEVKPNLTQRVGYFGTQNGFFLELADAEENLCFTERSYVSGSVQETRISQLGGVYGFEDTGWNVDKLDGTGPSEITLDITKAQILFMDIEWLGTGTVRMGFVINGDLIVCHKFNHANLITSTYITTACLPVRYEIFNTAGTGSASLMKQICSTVISEGGYQLRGRQQGVGTPVTTPKALGAAGAYYPIVSIRLRSSYLDAIAIASAISLMGVGNNEKFRWELRSGGTVTGGTWNTLNTNSAVEYTVDSTTLTGGTALASGFFSSSNQGSPTIDLSGELLLKYQLERNSFTGVATTLTLAVAPANTSQSVYGSLDWEEISR